MTSNPIWADSCTLPTTSTWCDDGTPFDVEPLHWLIHGATSFQSSDIGSCVIRSDDMARSEVTPVPNHFEFDLFGSSFEGLTISIKTSIEELHTLCVD